MRVISVAFSQQSSTIEEFQNCQVCPSSQARTKPKTAQPSQLRVESSSLSFVLSALLYLVCATAACGAERLPANCVCWAIRIFPTGSQGQRLQERGKPEA